MSHRLAPAVLAALMAAPSAPAAGSPDGGVAEPAVKIVFVHPERFTDVGDREVTSPNVRAAFLRALERHVLRSATARLAPGERLTVTITDIDMAGAFEPWRRTGTGVRIVRDVYPPRIDLAFALTDASGAPIREGRRQLVGMDFLARPTLPSTDPLVHEKALLDDWIGVELGAARTVGR